MAIVKHCDEITALVFQDGSGKIYRRNDFNSPYVFKGESIARWHQWLHILETADQYPVLSKAIEDVELLYNIVRGNEGK